MTHALTLLVSMYVILMSWIGCPNPKHNATLPSENSSMITPSNFDGELLALLVHNRINEVRRKRRKSTLQMDAILKQAATEQTYYVIQQKYLTHYQQDSYKQTVSDRVKYYGGNQFINAGENLQYIGLARYITNTYTQVIFPSYDDMAKDIVKGWVKSSGHYQNIIDNDFQYVGTSIRYEPSTYRIYATQVFGGKKEERFY